MTEQIIYCGHYGWLYKGCLHTDLASAEWDQKADADHAEYRATRSAQEREYWDSCLTVRQVIEKLRELPQDARFAVNDDGEERGIDAETTFHVEDMGDYTVVSI